MAFGGNGYDSAGTEGDLNDLWMFNPTSGMWTWVSGSATLGANGIQPGVWGTQGVPAPSNVPSGREASVSWIDSSGNLWLFGGYGADVTGVWHGLNDLWEFNPKNNTWTWIGGTDEADEPGTYGNGRNSIAEQYPRRKARGRRLDRSRRLPMASAEVTPTAARTSTTFGAFSRQT